MKIRLAFLDLLHAYGRTDGQSELNRSSAEVLRMGLMLAVNTGLFYLR
jgi:hypothetical protein